MLGLLAATQDDIVLSKACQVTCNTCTICFKTFQDMSVHRILRYYALMLRKCCILSIKSKVFTAAQISTEDQYLADDKIR